MGRLIQGLVDSVIFQAPLTQNWFADHQRRLQILEKKKLVLPPFLDFSATEAFAILTHTHKPFKLTQTQSEGDRLRGWGAG